MSLPAAFVALALAVSPGMVRGDDTSRPNLVFILADDLGARDLGCYGHPRASTPHLDALASESIRFTRAYAPAPICSASRAAFLTGKTPARLAFEFVTKSEPGRQELGQPLRTPPFTLDLEHEEVTVAECLAGRGYRTAFFGKWHLNRHHGRYLGWSPSHGPATQGFEVTGDTFGSHPYGYEKGKAGRVPLELEVGEFPRDSLNERAIEFLQQDHDLPFFLMLSHYYVHTPVHTRVGWLYERALAALPEDAPRREARARYAAMVSMLDHLVGEVVAAVDAAGLRDSTFVVFTSDNGGHPAFEGNAPLRGSKWNLYEGGVRVPLLVRLPGGRNGGAECAEVVSGIDLFPTFAAIAGAADEAGVDGQNLLPLFEGAGEKLPERALLWHFPYYHPETGFAEAPGRIGVDDGVTSQTRPVSAVLEGDWKLIRFHESGRDELYQLGRDPAESENVVDRHPEQARRLGERLEAALEEAGARMPTAEVEAKEGAR